MTLEPIVFSFSIKVLPGLSEEFVSKFGPAIASFVFVQL